MAKVSNKPWQRSFTRRDKSLDRVVWSAPGENKEGLVAVGQPIGKGKTKARLHVLEELDEPPSPISFTDRTKLYDEFYSPSRFMTPENGSSFSVYLRQSSTGLRRRWRGSISIAYDFATIDEAERYAEEWWRAVKGFNCRSLCREHADCIESPLLARACAESKGGKKP